MKKALILCLIIFLSGLNLETKAQDNSLNKKENKLTFEVHPIIEEYINYYRGRGRSSFEIQLARSGQFYLITRRIFREEEVPENLVWITQGLRIEPARAFSTKNQFKPLWFFSKSDAKKYGLRITKYVDERKDFEKSTRAMAQHLKFLSKQYNGDWKLAIAAYWSSQSEVNKAIKKTRSKKFWEIYPNLPIETRSFTPSVLAIILITDNLKFYEFENVVFDPPLAYEKVRLPPSIDLNLIAQYSETDFQRIKYLNPQLIKDITPPKGFIVRVPKGKAGILVENLKKLYLKKKPSEIKLKTKLTSVK